MTTSVGCESEILLLREYAEKPTGMNKYNILRAGKAALIAFQNFIHHAVECLARVDGIEKQSLTRGQRLNNVENLGVADAVSRTQITFLSEYAQSCSIDLGAGSAFEQIGVARLPVRNILTRALGEIVSVVRNIESNDFLSKTKYFVAGNKPSLSSTRSRRGYYRAWLKV